MTSNAQIITQFESEITKRGLTTPAGWDGFRKKVTDSSGNLALIKGEGWYKYSSRVGSWFQTGAYLYGIDEDQPFAVRVPATLRTVAEALDWLTPAPIRDARISGMPTKRQGDIFFRPYRIKSHDMRALQGTRHEARQRKGGGLTIVHPQHKPVILSAKYKWRAIQSTQVGGQAGD